MEVEASPADRQQLQLAIRPKRVLIDTPEAREMRAHVQLLQDGGRPFHSEESIYDMLANPQELYCSIAPWVSDDGLYPLEEQLRRWQEFRQWQRKHRLPNRNMEDELEIVPGPHRWIGQSQLQSQESVLATLPTTPGRDRIRELMTRERELEFRFLRLQSLDPLKVPVSYKDRVNRRIQCWLSRAHLFLMYPDELERHDETNTWLEYLGHELWTLEIYRKISASLAIRNSIARGELCGALAGDPRCMYAQQDISTKYSEQDISKWAAARKAIEPDVAAYEALNASAMTNKLWKHQANFLERGLLDRLADKLGQAAKSTDEHVPRALIDYLCCSYRLTTWDVVFVERKISRQLDVIDWICGQLAKMVTGVAERIIAMRRKRRKK